MESRKMVEVDLFAEQKQSHTSREQTYGHHVRKSGQHGLEIGINTYTLLCIK